MEDGLNSSIKTADVSLMISLVPYQCVLSRLTFLYKITQVYSKISNTMQEGRLTFVVLFCHVGRATAAGRYNVQIRHSYPYGTQSGLASPGLI
jgi:hypothetical protein